MEEAEENITEYKDILTTVQWKIAKRLLPVTVIFYLLIIIGIFGNIGTIAFHVHLQMRKSSYLLITSMAFADLGTCLAAIPVFSEMTINVKYSLAFVCKFSNFFGVWAGIFACFVLWLFSFDRYRKICKPLGKQMTFATVKYLVIGITAFSFLFSVRRLVTYNTVKVEVVVGDANTTVIGLHCAKLNDDNIISTVYHTIGFLIMLMIWITVVVTYLRIILTVMKRRLVLTKLSAQNKLFVIQTSGVKAYTEKSISKQEQNLRDMVTEKEKKLHITDLDVITESHTLPSSNEVHKDMQINSKSKLQNTTFEYSNVRRPSEVKLTLMMCAVSIIYILCFTPYFVVNFFFPMVNEYDKEYDFSAWIQFALKFPYVNSAFNPIIYFIFNPNLRRYVVACFTKCRYNM